PDLVANRESRRWCVGGDPDAVGDTADPVVNIDEQAIGDLDRRDGDDIGHFGFLLVVDFRVRVDCRRSMTTAAWCWIEASPCGASALAAPRAPPGNGRASPRSGSRRGRCRSDDGEDRDDPGAVCRQAGVDAGAAAE